MKEFCDIKEPNKVKPMKKVWKKYGLNNNSIINYWNKNEGLRACSGTTMNSEGERNNAILDVDPSIYSYEPGLSMIFYKTQFPGARSKVKEICYNKVSKKYGDSLPVEIEDKLETELRNVEDTNSWSCLYFAYLISSRLRDLGYQIGDGCCTIPFVAYLLGISEINPLPQHYYCPACKTVKWLNIGETESVYNYRQYGEDAKSCTICNGELEEDGHNITFGTTLTGSKNLRISITLNVPEEAIRHILTCLNKVLDRSDLVHQGFPFALNKEEPVAYLYVCNEGIVSALHRMEKLSGTVSSEIKSYEVDIARFFEENDYRGMKKIYSRSNNNHKLSGHFLWKMPDVMQIEDFSDLVQMFCNSESAILSAIADEGPLTLKIGQQHIADAVILMRLIWYKMNYPKVFRKAVRR